MDNLWIWVILIVFLFLLIAFKCFRKENYQIAKDPASTDMFERLKEDLSRLYPVESLDLKGLVSCVPEDSYTENKRHVSICLRNKEGNFYPYAKLLKIGIHELAHVMSKGYDPEHKTPEFISNYSFLMNKAHEMGYKVE